MHAIVAAGLLLALVLEPIPQLNERVVEFARSRIGETVGDGECTTLVREALRAAGASRPRYHEAEGRLVWGEELKSLDEALPGDVLHFKDAVFRGRKVLRNRTYRYWEQTYPEHTAIIATARKARGGMSFGILHQNVLNKGEDESKRKLVREGTIQMAELRSGTVTAFRPVDTGR